MSDLFTPTGLAQLQQLIAMSPTAVVEFGATWCGPCKKFLPHFTDFAERNPDITCIKVDVDSDRAVLEEFKIQSVPQVMLFRNGKYERHLKARTLVALIKEIG